MNGTDTKTISSDQDNQFWAIKDIDLDYWNGYLKFRPKYDRGPLYDTILQYSRANSKSSPSVAHDIATGPGQVAAFLAKHFDRVVASDLNTTHLSVGQQLNPNSNIQFYHAGAEDLHEGFDRASASLITAAECMPLLNAAAAVKSFHSLLAPSGTLAIWFYGRPSFAPEPADTSFSHNECNAIYNEICTAAFRPLYSVTGDRLTNAQKSMDTMSNWLDNVDLDAGQWMEVRRMKWNSGVPIEFSSADDPALGWTKNIVNNIHEGEEVMEMTDTDMWSEMWTSDDWKGFLKINLPSPFGEKVGVGDDSKWKELQKAMGGSGVKRKTIWPVVLILATKR